MKTHNAICFHITNLWPSLLQCCCVCYWKLLETRACIHSLPHCTKPMPFSGRNTHCLSIPLTSKTWLQNGSQKREYPNAKSPIMVLITLPLSSSWQVTFYLLFNRQNSCEFHPTNDIEVTSREVKWRFYDICKTHISKITSRDQNGR